MKMKWYAAHIIMYVEFRDGELASGIPVWENIVIFRGQSHAEIVERATAYGRDAEGDARGSMRWNGREAIMRFAGVRRTVECEDAENMPSDGHEVSYSECTVSSDRDLELLASGRDVTVRLVKDFAPHGERS